MPSPFTSMQQHQPAATRTSLDPAKQKTPFHHISTSGRSPDCHISPYLSHQLFYQNRGFAPLILVFGTFSLPVPWSLLSLLRPSGRGKGGSAAVAAATGAGLLIGPLCPDLGCSHTSIFCPCCQSCPGSSIEQESAACSSGASSKYRSPAPILQKVPSSQTGIARGHVKMIIWPCNPDFPASVTQPFCKSPQPACYQPRTRLGSGLLVRQHPQPLAGRAQAADPGHLLRTYSHSVTTLQDRSWHTGLLFLNVNMPHTQWMKKQLITKSQNVSGSGCRDGHRALGHWPDQWMLLMLPWALRETFKTEILSKIKIISFANEHRLYFILLTLLINRYSSSPVIFPDIGLTSL